MTKKLIRNAALFLCMALLAQTLLPANCVQAASKKSKALKAYKSYMQKQSKDSIFAVLYLDKDAVPELIYYLPGKEIYKIYTWKNNQMKQAYSFDLINNEMPEGHEITHYYKKKGAFISIPHAGAAWVIPGKIIICIRTISMCPCWVAPNLRKASDTAVFLRGENIT